MDELPVPTFLSGAFDIDQDAKMLSGEASCLRFTKLGRLYDDAMDLGIAVERENHRRCRIVRFHLVRTEVRDGDMLWWDFAVCSESVRTAPALEGWTVRIYND